MNQFSWCWSRSDPRYCSPCRETCRPARASVCTTRSRWNWMDLVNLDWTGSVRRTPAQTESAADESTTVWIPSLPETACPGLQLWLLSFIEWISRKKVSRNLEIMCLHFKRFKTKLLEKNGLTFLSFSWHLTFMIFKVFLISGVTFENQETWQPHSFFF